MDKMYLSKIVQGGNTLYIKDSEAREAISALEAYSDYVGVTTTALGTATAAAQTFTGSPVSVTVAPAA